jgi:hypothetical protein
MKPIQLCGRLFLVWLFAGMWAFAQKPRVEIGVQASVVDQQEAVGEKPLMAGV